jgi:hypothetical protein
MAFCPYCGELVAGADSFCRRCGRELNPSARGAPIFPVGDSGFGNVKKTCPVCEHSSGTDPRGFGFSRCPVCHGRRYNLVPKNTPGCMSCGGTGMIPFNGLNITGSLDRVCEICGGTGYAPGK